MTENENIEVFLELQEKGKNNLKLKELKQLALKHHIDNFNEIVSKCTNSFECIEKNINLLIDAMNQFTEQIIKENQEKDKSKRDKNR